MLCSADQSLGRAETPVCARGFHSDLSAADVYAQYRTSLFELRARRGLRDWQLMICPQRTVSEAAVARLSRRARSIRRELSCDIHSAALELSTSRARGATVLGPNRPRPSGRAIVAGYTMPTRFNLGLAAASAANWSQWRQSAPWPYRIVVTRNGRTSSLSGGTSASTLRIVPLAYEMPKPVEVFAPVSVEIYHWIALAVLSWAFNLRQAFWTFARGVRKNAARGARRFAPWAPWHISIQPDFCE